MLSTFQNTQHHKTRNEITRTGKPEDIHNIMNYMMSKRFKSPGDACIPQAEDVTVTSL